MVSFFGLKLGSDRKKKSGQTNDHHGSQAKKKTEKNSLADPQLFVNDLSQSGTYAASIYSTTSRPGSSYSTYRPKKSAKHESHNLAGIGYFDSGSRPATSYAPTFSRSTTNFGPSQWNASSTNLEGPSALKSRRPSVSSVKSARLKAWVNPLDVHFGKRDSSASAIVMPTQGLRPSPLARKESPAAPPLPIAPAVPARNPLRNPPSPPRSIRTMKELDACLCKDKPPGTDPIDARPPSPVSSNVNATKADEGRPDFAGLFGPSSLPSPPLSVPRTSDEDNSREEPVIQNVRAKRDLKTVGPSRQRSFKMKVESPAQVDSSLPPSLPSSLPPPRPKTSGGPDIRRPDRRPSALNLGRLSQSVPSGPLSATFGPTRPLAEFGGRERSYTTGRSAGPPPIASAAALNRLSRSSKDLGRQSRQRYTYAAARASYSSSVYDSPPPSPGSPVMPRSGPLASPRVPTPTTTLPRHPIEASEYAYDLPDWSALAEDGPQEYEQESGQDSPPRNWPLSSGGGQATSQKAPQLPDPRSDSPFGIPSFSRPWTGAHARPGTPVKTTEITITTSLRTQSPPRTGQSFGLRNPAIVGDDFGTGFI